MKPHVSTFLVGLLFASQLPAAERLFPTDAGIINVKSAPYNARGDGVTDDTAAIQAAIRFAIDRSDRYSAIPTVYLPTGTYLVTNTLENRLADTNYSQGWRSGMVLVGQSDTGTVIRLRDNAPGFSDPANPKAVFRTGSELPNNNDPEGRGNQAFRHYIMNLTVNTGSGNPGAVGIDYLVNNRGAVEDVTIRSGDGAGVCGLLMIREWPGPALIKRVCIEGFDTGMMMRHMEYSMTFEHLTLVGQRRQGIQVRDNVAIIRDLVSTNSVPVIVVTNSNTHVTLVDALFAGGASTNVAITNRGKLYLRNATSTGYGKLVAAGVGAGADVPGGAGFTNLAEYVSHPIESLFPSPQRALHLAVRETPEFHTNDLSQWANVVSFGATPDNSSNDDAPGIQAAIDSGKPVVYLPRGEYRINRPIVLRGAVRKFMGFHASIKTNASFTGGPLVLFTNGSADTCVLEFLRLHDSWVEHASTNALVLRHMDISKGYRNTAQGTGDLFTENNMMRPLLVNYPQRVWSRQLNSEGGTDPLVENHGGRMWILGLKTEGGVTAIKTVGGVTELLGALCYPASGVATNVPLFINEGGHVSYSYVTTGYVLPVYALQISETRDGLTRQLLRPDVPSRGNGSNVPLYVGYTDTLRLTGLQRDEFGRWRFEVQARPWLRYAIEASSDLLAWEPIHTNTATAAACTFTDTNNSTAPLWFYRTRQIEP